MEAKLIKGSQSVICKERKGRRKFLSYSVTYQNERGIQAPTAYGVLAKECDHELYRVEHWLLVHAEWNQSKLGCGESTNRAETVQRIINYKP